MIFFVVDKVPQGTILLVLATCYRRLHYRFTYGYALVVPCGTLTTTKFFFDFWWK